MSEMEIAKVLEQMRSMAAQANSAPAQQAEPVQGKADFGALLKQSLDAVNETQQKAGDLTESFQAGDPNTELSEVMIALQKASVSFEAVTQVRNKLIDAYQEIMRMSF